MSSIKEIQEKFMNSDLNLPRKRKRKVSSSVDVNNPVLIEETVQPKKKRNLSFRDRMTSTQNLISSNREYKTSYGTGNQHKMVVDYLQKIQKYATNQDIFEKIGVNVGPQANKEVFDRLVKNKSVIVEDLGQNMYKFMYKSKYHEVKTKKDLYLTIEKNPDGIKFESLTDCYEGAENDLYLLEQERRVFIRQNRNQKIVFPNDLSLESKNVSVELREKFNKVFIDIQVPDTDIVIEENIKTQGQHVIVIKEARNKKSNSKKTRKRSSRNKIQNIHVPGYDFSKPYEKQT
eukprot:TRINITY_DN15108_c0_g1_i1.p1 TRINITY_DN15108_c0_g1~~TRINITY_DN15108_c0_g1_i1.p1  ORF type:complete len:310 (+),score=51.18 TRINITY_DN15108_c0_g1_i1:64-930(+)